MAYYKVKIKMKWEKKWEKKWKKIHNELERIRTIFQHRFVTHWHRHPFFFFQALSLFFCPPLVKNDMIIMCVCVHVMMDQMVYAQDYWLYMSINTITLTIIWYPIWKFIRLKHFILGVNLTNFQIDKFKFQWIWNKFILYRVSLLSLSI